MSKTARMEQTAANKPPFLTPGDVSPEALRAWEMGCRQFFMHKSVDAAEQVAKVAWGMQDPRIQDWYLNDQDRINKLSFAEYLAEIRSYWLSSDLVDVVRQKMLSSNTRQQTVQRVGGGGAEPEHPPAWLHIPPIRSDINLRYHLESHMKAQYHRRNSKLRDAHSDPPHLPVQGIMSFPRTYLTLYLARMHIMARVPYCFL